MSIEEPESNDDSLGWKGTSMNDIFEGRDSFFHEHPPIRPSENHAVLFKVNIKYTISFVFFISWGQFFNPG